MTTFEAFPDRIRQLSDDDYLRLLERSLETRTVDGVTFPGFPETVIQANFVGSSGKSALSEASVFWRYLKKASADLGKRITATANVLDFGCGWGRFLRFLAKDVDGSHLYGVDVDPDILTECRELGVPGSLACVEPFGRLPFQDAHFDVVMAYSVFTPLPQPVNLHWMREIARVCRPGAVFALTLEPRRFLAFVRDEAPRNTSPWHRSLARFSDRVNELMLRFDRGEFIYIPTGGGSYRPESTYGEAVIPQRWIELEWGGLWQLREYVDDRSRFWQAAMVVQRR